MSQKFPLLAMEMLAMFLIYDRLKMLLASHWGALQDGDKETSKTSNILDFYISKFQRECFINSLQTFMICAWTWHVLEIYEKLTSIMKFINKQITNQNCSWTVLWSRNIELYYVVSLLRCFRVPLMLFFNAI